MLEQIKSDIETKIAALNKEISDLTTELIINEDKEVFNDRRVASAERLVYREILGKLNQINLVEAQQDYGSNGG